MKIGILSVATNIYIDYWRDLAQSIENNCTEPGIYNLHVFTNQVAQVEFIASNFRKISVTAHQIENLGWPDATLLRYEIFAKFESQIRESNLLYLDADMLVEHDVSKEVIRILEVDDVALVAHPGFWKSAKKTNIWKQIHSDKGYSPSLKRLFSIRTKGSWENRKKSAAFVPRNRRKNYVCGGTWMARRSNFFEMVRILKESVDTDIRNGVMATWHDESHLNKWAAYHQFRLLDPSFCFVKEYLHLQELDPKIIAVTKEIRTR